MSDISISLISSDSFMETNLSGVTQQELRDFPLLVGATLAENDGMAEAVLGALSSVDTDEKAGVVGDIMGGMMMDGLVEYRTVRFPRLHKRMGRFVVGNRVYYTPVNPESA